MSSGGGGGGGSWRKWRKKKSTRSAKGQETCNSTNNEQLKDSPVTEAGSSAQHPTVDQSAGGGFSSKFSSSSKRRRKNKWREASCHENTGHSMQQHRQYDRQTSKSTPSMRTSRLLEPRNSEISSTSGASTSSSTQAEGRSESNSGHSKKIVQDIPGFYYDEERKRYFRILPGHSGGKVVTTETIRQKEADKKRQHFLEGRATGTLVDKEPSKKTMTSFVQLEEDRRRGNCRSSYFKRMAHESAVKQMEVKPSSQVSPFPDRYFDGESGYISNLELDSRQKQVLMVISDDYLSRLWQGEVINKRNQETGRDEVTIAKWATVNILTTRNCKVTHASWAQVKEGENMYALYAISGGITSSVQLFKCPTEEDGISHMSYRYESNHEMAWTCAWSNSPTLPAHLAIGSTRKAIVMDTLSSQKQTLHTCHSDVFVQAFSRKSPVLYNGTRRGEVLGIDLRKPSHGHVDMTAVLRHRVSVCSLKLLKEENYVLTSDMGGEIKLWDVRQCAVVQEFKGHHNENHHLQVKVDSTETILHAVGQDKYTRVWSLKTGDLLHTIPCPSSCQEDNTPVSVYSQEFSCHAQPGFFLGQERQLYWYPMRTMESVDWDVI